MEEIGIRLYDLNDTGQLASCLAAVLQPGDSLVLCGDLGAGKTTLTQLLLGEWGIEHVLSPTFTLMHSYQASFMIHHLDLYRLERVEEVWHLGWDELCGGTALVIVEWLDKFPELYPDNYLQVKLCYAEQGRLAILTAGGARGEAILEELKHCAFISH